jgi:thiol:disulfide interchange protein
MKITALFPIALAVCLSCCESKKTTGVSVNQNAESKSPQRSPLDPPDFWKPLERKLADYVAAHPGRPIVLSISSKWSSTSTLAWRVLFSDEVTKSLEHSGFLCLVADVTEGDTLATGEMNTLGRVAVPVTAIYDPVDAAWHVQPEVFSASDVRKWISSLQNKIAEQAAPSDGDKPSN